MKYLLVLPVIFLHSCAGFAPIADDMEKVLDNDAILIRVEKDAMQKETNVDLEVHITNHDVDVKPE